MKTKTSLNLQLRQHIETRILTKNVLKNVSPKKADYVLEITFLGHLLAMFEANSLQLILIVRIL